MGDDYQGPLDPEGWFWKGHLPGTLVCIPPPATGSILYNSLQGRDTNDPTTLPKLYWFHACYTGRSGKLALRKKLTSGLWCMLKPFGLIQLTNLYLLGSLSPSFYIHLIDDSSAWNAQKCWKSNATCQACLKRVTFKSGIICANYGATRGHFQWCLRASCTECFKSHGLDCFEVKLPCDFYGASLAEAEDEKWFKVAWPGDHLCFMV
jgi:hypothetical protein